MSGTVYAAELFLATILVNAGLGDKLVPYGSRFVCDPPVEDTDIDFFFYVPDDREKDLDALLLGHGFEKHEEQGDPDSSRPSWGDQDPDRRFTAYRRGLINLVTTSSAKFALRHIAATRVCKRLNLLDKKDRIMIYRAVLYGKSPCES